MLSTPRVFYATGGRQQYISVNRLFTISQLKHSNFSVMVGLASCGLPHKKGHAFLFEVDRV